MYIFIIKLEDLKLLKAITRIVVEYHPRACLFILLMVSPSTVPSALLKVFLITCSQARVI